MGAYSSLRAFDFERHRQYVVPALQTWLETGQRSPELEASFKHQYQRHTEAENRHQDFYQQHARPSQQMFELQLMLERGQVELCEQLDADLGAKAKSLQAFAELVPQIHGACQSASCIERSLCVFNPQSAGYTHAEAVMRLFQQLVKSSCLEQPEAVLLGKSFQFDSWPDWYGYEAGYQDDLRAVYELAARDSLAWKLARLTRRGAIWGWADGGYGEGLLGWLSPAECLDLCESLRVYDLQPDAPLPAELSDPFVQTQWLPEFRQSLLRLQDFAWDCGHQGLGMLLERQ